MTLSEKEEKLVRKYNLLPQVAAASLIMDFVMCGVWLILVMVDDIVFDNRTFFSMGLYVFLAIVVFYLLIFLYSMFVTRFGMSARAWKELVQKLDVWQDNGDYTGLVAGAVGLGAAGRILGEYGKGAAKKIGKGLEAAGAVGAIGITVGMNWEMLSNARRVASVCNIQIPKAKKYVIPLVLVPLALLVGLYIPEYADSMRVVKEEKQLAAETVYHLQEEFEKTCYYVSADDPFEEYQDYGYSVYGYLYDFDEQRSYLSVRVGNDGLVTEVIYHVELDIQKSKQENMALLEKDLKRLYGLLSEADVRAASEDLLREYALPEDFMETLAAGSYYDEINIKEEGQDGSSIYFSYVTEPEEEYDEYSASYVSISIRAN